jgi:hypothetical protein
VNLKATLRRWLRDPDSFGEDADVRFATAHGLRQLADLLEDHPEARLPSTYATTVWDSTYAQDHDEAMEHLRGKARLFGGRWEKKPEGETFTLVRKLGGLIEYHLRAPREAVCEKRVVGTRQVQRPVQSFEVPEMETVYEDEVEWDCPTVLA